MLNYGNRKWNKSLPKREREMEINCEIWGVLLRGVVLRGHVERRPVDSVVRRVDQMKRRQTIRGRGRPKKTILSVIGSYIIFSDAFLYDIV